MKKLILVFLVMIFITAPGFTQEAAGVPEKVKVSLDALLQTRTPNGFFNMRSVNSYFYASQGAVYVNVLFYADLENDREELKAKLEADHAVKMEEYNKFVAKEEKKLEERNKRIREKNRDLPVRDRLPEKTWEKPEAPKLVIPKNYHNLYMRVVQGGKTVQEYKAPMPDDDVANEYYSFGVIIKPGKYDILLNINRFDDSQDGTLLIEQEVPKLTVMDIVTPTRRIENSPPTFYKKVNTLHVAENRFNVVKNSYQVSPSKLEFFPYTDKENKFKVSDTPILTFFVLGVIQPWSIDVKMEVKQGKKKVVAFKVPLMENPYFYQILEFKDKDKKPLAVGDYTLSIALTDNNMKTRRGKVEIPFKIVE